MATKNLTFSEGIREAARLYPQATGSYALWDADNATYEVCAIGAACVSLGYGPDKLDRDFRAFEVLQEGYGVSLNHVLSHPITKTRCSLLAILFDLNDSEGWSLNEIADWLEKEGL